MNYKAAADFHSVGLCQTLAQSESSISSSSSSLEFSSVFTEHFTLIVLLPKLEHWLEKGGRLPQDKIFDETRTYSHLIHSIRTWRETETRLLKSVEGQFEERQALISNILIYSLLCRIFQ